LGNQETSFKVIQTHFPRVFGEARDFIQSNPNPFSKGIWGSSTSFELESTKAILLLLVELLYKAKVTTTNNQQAERGLTKD
jgi:hypothetical protein